MKKYLINTLISIDQFFNTITGGDPDETISSRMGKWNRGEIGGVRQKISYVICLALNKLDKDHCQDAIEEDEGDDAVARTPRTEREIKERIEKVQSMPDCDHKQRELAQLHKMLRGR